MAVTYLLLVLYWLLLLVLNLVNSSQSKFQFTLGALLSPLFDLIPFPLLTCIFDYLIPYSPLFYLIASFTSTYIYLMLD